MRQHVIPAPRGVPAATLNRLDGISCASFFPSVEALGYRYLYHDRGELKPRTWQDAYIFQLDPNRAPSEALEGANFVVVAAMDLPELDSRWQYGLFGYRSANFKTAIHQTHFPSFDKLVGHLRGLASQTGDNCINSNAVDGVLALPFEQIPNWVAQSLVRRCEGFANPAYAVHHPWETKSCDDKLKMIEQTRRLYPNHEIRIAQGSVFTFETSGQSQHLLHIQDAYPLHDPNGKKLRVDTALLEERLNLQPQSLRMFSGNLTGVTGLRAGGISPFVHKFHRLSTINFDESLFLAEARNPRILFDFAITPDKSILASPSSVLKELQAWPTTGACVVRLGQQRHSESVRLC